MKLGICAASCERIDKFFYPYVLGQVSVSTKNATSDKQYVWEGEADTSSYTIREETDPEKFIPRGTVITLHLKVHMGEPVPIQIWYC